MIVLIIRALVSVVAVGCARFQGKSTLRPSFLAKTGLSLVK